MNRLLRSAIASLLVLLPVAAHAADDPFMGTWRLDKAKSSIGKDPGVKNKVIVFSPGPGGGAIVENLEMASGQKQTTRLTFVYGELAPQTEAGLDAFAVVKASDTREFWVAQLKGKVVALLQVDVSADGKEMTFRYLATVADPTGKVMSDRYVYDRQ